MESERMEVERIDAHHEGARVATVQWSNRARARQQVHMGLGWS
jgi:hypothetical protein